MERNKEERERDRTNSKRVNLDLLIMNIATTCKDNNKMKEVNHINTFTCSAGKL